MVLARMQFLKQYIKHEMYKRLSCNIKIYISMTKVRSRLRKDIYKLHNEQRYPENTEDSHKSMRKRKTQKAQYIKRQGTRCVANRHLKRCPMSQVRSQRTRLRFHFTLPGKIWVCQKNQLFVRLGRNRYLCGK